MDKLRERTTIQRVLTIALDRVNESIAQGEAQQQRMPFDHDNNDALIENRKWKADVEAALRQQTPAVGEHEMSLFPHIKTTGRWCLTCTESGVAQAASLVQRITNYLADNDSLTDVKISDLLRDCRSSLASQPDTPPTPREGLRDMAIKWLLDQAETQCFTNDFRPSHVDSLVELLGRAAGQTSGDALREALEAIDKDASQPASNVYYSRFRDGMKEAVRRIRERAALGQTSTAEKK